MIPYGCLDSRNLPDARRDQHRRRARAIARRRAQILPQDHPRQPQSGARRHLVLRLGERQAPPSGVLGRPQRPHLREPRGGRGRRRPGVPEPARRALAVVRDYARSCYAEGLRRRRDPLRDLRAVLEHPRQLRRRAGDQQGGRWALLRRGRRRHRDHEHARGQGHRRERGSLRDLGARPGGDGAARHHTRVSERRHGLQDPARHQPRRVRGRVPRAARRVRLRQVHAAQHHRRHGQGHLRRVHLPRPGPLRRRRQDPHRVPPPQHRLHLPELQPHAQPQRLPEPRAHRRAGGRPHAHRRGARERGPRLARQELPLALVRRPAAAHLHRARPGQAPQDHPRRRAHRRARLHHVDRGALHAREGHRAGHDDGHGHAQRGDRAWPTAWCACAAAGSTR